jgi:hypothetical protein
LIKAQALRKRKKETAMVNPQRRRQAKHAKRHSPAKKKRSGAPRQNPATLLLGTLNPENSPMFKKKSKKSTAPRRKAAKKNPFFSHKKKSVMKFAPRRKAKRNPDAKSIIKRPVELLKAGAVGALAFFFTRQIPQLVLNARNTSYVGYLANMLTALGCAAAADRYFGAAAGQAAFVGGGMYTFSRVWDDYSPLGQSISLSATMSGVQGDPRAVGMARPARLGVGGMVPGYWASPATVARDGSPIIPQQIVDAVKAQMPAPAVANGKGIGRFAGRF